MSHPVISGFTSAAALIIGFSQLKHIVGLPLPRTENIAETLWLTVTQVNAMDPVALAIGVGGIVLLLGLKRISSLLPGAMIAVVIATLVVWGSIWMKRPASASSGRFRQAFRSFQSRH